MSGARGLQSEPTGEPEWEEKGAKYTAEHQVSVGEGGSFEQGCRQEGLWTGDGELPLYQSHFLSP